MLCLTLNALFNYCALDKSLHFGCTVAGMSIRSVSILIIAYSFAQR